MLIAGENVSAELLAEVSALPHPARRIGVFRRGDLPRYEERPVALALWHVADPGNLGTLLRSADAFGAAVALSPACADPTGPKALRASAGAAFRVPIGGFDDPRGRRIALAAHEGKPLPELELDKGTVFVLGAERIGLPPEVIARCEETATIPTPGPAESLNVAAAGAIALYDWSGRRAAQTESSPPR
ncbi:MAG: RNA methyltransferase [Actinomycetota bacterium]|nr:RNA methyltransferase [Actinomycetota bacterium]